jgi:hypothetical protein
LCKNLVKSWKGLLKPNPSTANGSDGGKELSAAEPERKRVKIEENGSDGKKHSLVFRRRRVRNTSYWLIKLVILY